MSYTHNKKYIIIAGCSYAHKSLETIHKILGSPNEEHLEFVNVNTSSASNEFILESILFACNSLLKENVSPKNILVINNFTQIGRLNLVVPSEFEKDIENTLKVTELRKVNDLTYKFFNTFVQINKRIYHLMIGHYGLTSSLKAWVTQKESYYTKEKRTLSYFEDYLKSIILLQSFLKQNKIEHISFMMSNVFEGWFDDLSHVYTKSTEWKLPSTKNTKHISELSEILSIFWKMIDLSKISFYESEENKYGGIDEYFIDKFKKKSYLEDVDSRGYFFGNHPVDEVYEEFTKELMKDKILKWNQQNLL